LCNIIILAKSKVRVATR